MKTRTFVGWTVATVLAAAVAFLIVVRLTGEPVQYQAWP
jgi:hypothetical protein